MDNTSVRIFLVDDDPFCLNIYQQHLINHGYTDITTFDNGVGCINALTQMPDIVFLEHELDMISGIEVLKKIKRLNPDIYVIFLSGREDISIAVDALKYGAFDYIIKGERESEKIKAVIDKIKEVNRLLKSARPNFIKKVF